MAGTTSVDHISPQTNNCIPLHREMIGQIHQRSSSSGHDHSSPTTATSLVPCRQTGNPSNESTVSRNDSNSRGAETNVTEAGVSNNVGELVLKAKKAAASLWMILHAQVGTYCDACWCNIFVLVKFIRILIFHRWPRFCLLDFFLNYFLFAIHFTELPFTARSVPLLKLFWNQTHPDPRQKLPRWP